MKRPKLNLSITLNQALEPIVKENYKLCKIHEKEGYLLFFWDSDPNTGFYFGILKETTDSSGHNIHFSFKPASANKTEHTSTARKLDLFIASMESWFSNIEYYQKESILDDPFISEYRKEFYEDFKIVDDGSDFKPFNYIQQKLLNQYLENCFEKIDELEDDKNKQTIEGLKSDIKELQSELTSETKNGFMRRLSHIYAKAKKSGLKISEFLITELAKEILKKATNYGFDFAINHSQDITKYLHI